ncbi:MAG TPA: DNA-directed RNA polymerase subunit beta [bacterium]|nr:DNA-directed RNA polymerase subunit beta [bacterium]
MGILGQSNFRARRWFGKITKRVKDIPDLLQVQKSSFVQFLQKDAAPSERTVTGLESAFRSVFPITSFNNAIELTFGGYSLGEPLYDVEECKLRGTTYEIPLKIKVALASYEVDQNGVRKGLNDIKEQDIHFGAIPAMTDWCTFVINGTERVIVNQLHRSPGTFFDYDKMRSAAGNDVFVSRLVPYHGSWLDFEFDSKNLLYVKIDRKKKFPATVFLKAWGYSKEDLVSSYYFPERFVINKGELFQVLDHEKDAEQLREQKVPVDLYDKSGAIIVQEGKNFSSAVLLKLKKLGIKEIAIDPQHLMGKRLFKPVVDKSGTRIADVNDEITPTLLDEILKRGVQRLETIYIENMKYSQHLSDTLKIDKVSTREEALTEIYKIMVPSNPVNIDVAEAYFKNLFFNSENYDLSAVGRLRMNHKFGEQVPLTNRLLRREDVLNTVRYLLNLTDGRGVVDDIDHLGNRRVRLVGELLEDVFKNGLLRMAHSIKEKLAGAAIESLTPYEVIGYKQVTAVLKEFFAGGQLSQFMDQTNILSEMTHKRRLSALGPGGLAREHASFEVRDVHKTHYGRICPVETPEGPNVGLIVSLTTFAAINEFGYIETPYRVIEKDKATGRSKVTDKVVYLDAIKEQEHRIVPSSVPVDKNGLLMEDLVNARDKGDIVRVRSEEITLMDLAPVQIVSVSAALVPFLEHDDANRALMGSNMQRQAVPLVRAEAPLVGSGMEQFVARDSGYTVYAKRGGEVVKVDATHVVIKVDPAETEEAIDVDIYNLSKYRRSNQNTAVDQRPVVNVGDTIKKGDVIADGPAIDRGELALGRNVLIAFMPWSGYNFEDSILVNERLLHEDAFTSIHIEEFVCEARDTKRGPEEITADIPNAPDEVLRKLDESGIIRIGQKVRAGDILVGKVTPKGETVLSPEEKLLRAIFGEKAGDVKDSSLYVRPGVEGVVIDARIFARKGTKKDNRMKEQEKEQFDTLKRARDEEIRIIEVHTYEMIRKLLVGKTTDAPVTHEKGRSLIKKGEKLTADGVSKIPESQLENVSVSDRNATKKIKESILAMRRKIETVKKIYDTKTKQVSKNDDLAPGVIKSVKVFVAIKRKLSVGDKMSGRHGNKGVVSLLLPEGDMPYMADGRTVDIVLNPLGVPSRMNIGQILEVHLGLAARRIGEKINSYLAQNWSSKKLKEELKKLLDPSPTVAKIIDEADDDDVRSFIRSMKRGIHTASPVFDGAKDADIHNLLEYADQPQDGKVTLFDGRTGDPFESDVTVGIMYFLKLHHLVDEKVHARSTGPYSLVTQQPLGGKAQFGGQRLGEMEVWALEAYGAAYSLQEFLTVKSDDVEGRKKLYESIVRGKHKYDIGVPASFSVLVKEMQSLCLDVTLVEENR